MAGGRPTKYTPELLEKAQAYKKGWTALGDMIPSHLALASHLEVSTKTMYEWAKDEEKSEFRNILDNILDMQQRELINSGLSGDFNSAITKLVLGKHGYSDKVESDNKTTMAVTGLQVEYVDTENTDS